MYFPNEIEIIMQGIKVIQKSVMLNLVIINVVKYVHCINVDWHSMEQWSQDE